MEGAGKLSASEWSLVPDQPAFPTCSASLCTPRWRFSECPSHCHGNSYNVISNQESINIAKGTCHGVHIHATTSGAHYGNAPCSCLGGGMIYWKLSDGTHWRTAPFRAGVLSWRTWCLLWEMPYIWCCFPHSRNTQVPFSDMMIPLEAQIGPESSLGRRRSRFEDRGEGMK